MDTRFAGSQRLDERRRRRLAAESDDIADETSQVSRSEPLPAPDGRIRHAHQPAGDDSSGPAAENLPQLPLHVLIPTALWKHFAIAATFLALGGGILAANVQAGRWEQFVGPGVTQLFRVDGGPVSRWYASLLLLLSSQAAALIWWGRSRSTKDFDGRYRVWTKIAVAWLLCSAGIACDLHRSWNSTALWLLQRSGRQAEVLASLVPLAIFGAWLMWSLHREMRGCRLSLGMVYAASALFVASALATTQLIQVASAFGQYLLSDGMALASQTVLLHALLLHARHVLYHTAEPSAAPRGRKLRIPRPHFRWPSLRRFRKAAVAVDSTGKPTSTSRVRIDDKHETSGEKPKSGKAPLEKPAEVVAASPVKPRDVSPPQPVHKASEPSSVNEHTDDRFSDDDEQEATDYDAEDNDWSDDSSSRPNLKGMSKKQRRRLLQEQRERERGQRR